MHVMNRSAFRLWIAILALPSFIQTTELAGGAELRSTRGQRMVVRQVSTATEETDVILGSEELDEPVFESYSPQEFPFTPDTDASVPYGVVASSPYVAPSSHGFWAQTDFLLWWRNGRRFPPLVTRVVPAYPSPSNPAAANSLSLDEAPVVFGGGAIEEHGQPGGKLNFGMWLDAFHNFGLGGGFVAVGDSSVAFADASDGSIVGIGRPFFDTDANANTALIIAGGDNTPPRTDASSGWINLATDSKMLAGDLYYRLLMHQGGGLRTDFVFGYQYGRIDENLTVDAFTNNPTIGSWRHTDAFRTENQYHGGHFGLRGEYRYGRWGLELLAKFAFGNMRQTVLINGIGEFTDLAVPPTVSSTAGLLAQATNSGSYVQDRFAFAEDIKIAIAFWPTSRLKISAGYSLMYWSSVARPGDHIDFGVDGRLLSNPLWPAARPAFAFRPVGFYLHGLNLGMEYRF